MLIINILMQLVIKNINKRRILEITLLYSVIISGNVLDIIPGIGLYNGLYVEEMISKLIEIIIYIIGIIVIKYISRPVDIVTIIIVGMITIINSNDMIGLILGIEIETLGIYVLIGKESKRKNSIGIKYYILGAITSSLIYLGVSVTYGIIGVTSIEEIKIIKEINKEVNIPIYLIIYGLIFKLGGVPLHNYLSDIVEGIKMNVNIWVLGVSKITILLIINKINVGEITSLIIVIQLSLIVGALVGTIQKRIKRLITYSSINNIGYLLTGILIDTNIIKIGWIIYILQYTLTTINIILIIMSVGRIEEIKDIIILNKSMKLAMTISLLSLIGIPPTLGFYGKLYIMIPILESSMKLIIIIILISNIISSYYYIRLIKIIYNFSIQSREKLNGGEITSNTRVSLITLVTIIPPLTEVLNILIIIN